MIGVITFWLRSNGGVFFGPFNLSTFLDEFETNVFCLFHPAHLHSLKPGRAERPPWLTTNIQLSS